MKALCKKAKHEHEMLLKKVRTVMKTSEEHTRAERNGAFSRYHGMLRSNRVIVNAADERNAGHADTLIQLRLFFVEGRKVKAVVSLAGTSHRELWVAELESVLEAKELKLRMLPDFASENLILRAEARQLRGSVDTLCQKRKKVVMFSQDV